MNLFIEFLCFLAKLLMHFGSRHDFNISVKDFVFILLFYAMVSALF